MRTLAARLGASVTAIVLATVSPIHFALAASAFPKPTLTPTLSAAKPLIKFSQMPKSEAGEYKLLVDPTAIPVTDKTYLSFTFVGTVTVQAGQKPNSAPLSNGVVDQLTVGGFINDDAFAQVGVTRPTPHEARIAGYSLISGKLAKTASDGERVVVRQQNYAVDGAVTKAGLAKISVRSETIGTPPASFALDLEQSSVELTRIHPDELSVTGPRSVMVTRGKATFVSFNIKRRANRPDGPLTVASTAGGGIEVVGSKMLHFANVGSGITGRVQIAGDRIGQSSIGIAILDLYNAPNLIVDVDTVGHDALTGVDRILIGGPLLLLGGGFLGLLAFRRRSQR